MKILFSQKFEMKKLDSLVDSHFQRNKHSKEQIERLALIMREEGVTHPIFITKGTNRICFGHGRRDAALLNQWTEFPTCEVEFENDDQEYRMVQSDNAIASWAELDFAQINLDLPNLGPFDINLLGIKDFVVEPMDKYRDKDADEVPEVKEPFVKSGELWLLGNHRLLCGDSTKKEDVERLMNGEEADLVFTDPPYNVNYKSIDGKTIENDSMSDEDFLSFLTSAFTNIAKVLKNGSSFYICHADLEGFNFRYAVKLAELKVRQCCIWVKNSLVMGRQDYQWRHEPILYGWKEGEAHKWYADRAQTTVWEFNKPSRSEEHPTMKPVELVEYGVRNSSKVGDLVFEPFCGSGSTLIACEKTSRRCFGMEIDPHYCTVILERWAKFTGEDPKREDGISLSELKKSKVN